LLLEDLLNRSDNSFDVGKQLVGTSRRFQVSPETLNGVELRTVARQKDGQQVIFEYRKGSLAGQAMMDGTIVQDQDQWTISGMLLHQVLQKGDEGFTVAFLGDLVDNLIGDPVVGAKEMPPLWLTGGRNSFLATSLHPTGHQEGQPA